MDTKNTIYKIIFTRECKDELDKIFKLLSLYTPESYYKSIIRKIENS